MANAIRGGLAALALALAAGPASAQNFGNIPGESILGNPSSVAAPARPIPLHSLPLGSGLPIVANNAELHLDARVGPIYRAGFYTPGDGGAAVYNLSNAPCPVPDNGSQVAAPGGKCWLVGKQTNYDVRIWGARCDGTTDDTAALDAAFAFSSSLIIYPANCRGSTSPAYHGSTAYAVGGIWRSQDLAGTFPGTLEANSTHITNHAAATAHVVGHGDWLSFGGPGVTGAQMTRYANLSFNGGPTSPTNPIHAYQALGGQAEATNGDNGTVANPQGSLYGIGALVIGHNGAANMFALEGFEANAACETGCSASVISNGSFVALAGNAVRGSLVDSSITIGSEGPVPRKNAITLAGVHGGPPLASDGCVLCTQGAAIQIGDGIDLSAYTIAGSLLRSANADITGQGAVMGHGNDGILPPSANTTWWIKDNLSGSAGEVDLINAQDTGNGFQFIQKTGASTYVTVARMGPNGFFPPQATVAQLPACSAAQGTPGALWFVTDLAAPPTYRQTGLTGGGGIAGLVMCNGTDWEAH